MNDYQNEFAVFRKDADSREASPINLSVSDECLDEDVC